MYCEQRANYVLDPHLPLTDSLLQRPQAPHERRSKPRSTGALPARVWGVDSDDHPFSFDCLLDNISATGLYLRLPRRMNFSAAISLVVKLTHGPFQGMSAAIKGTVVRHRREVGGHTGIAVRIVEHRFI
jgi:PilZ domain-containing protein